MILRGSRHALSVPTASRRRGGGLLYDEIKGSLQHVRNFFKATVVPFLRPLSRSEM